MPGYSKKELQGIYDRTGGHCHLCNKKLARKNHGKHGRKGCWDVDHSRPKARGGTDHGNNLVAACTSCNRSKQDGTNGAIRAKNGFTSRPKSREERRSAAATAGVVTAVTLVILIVGVGYIAWRLGRRVAPGPM